MLKGKQHKKISDMVSDLSDDKSFVNEFNKRIAARRLVKALSVLRNSAGFTEQQLADKLGWTKDEICKLENGLDEYLFLSQVLAYAQACHYHFGVVFAKANKGDILSK